MDVIIVCHTEFGFIKNKRVIFDKNHVEGTVDGVSNLIKIADGYGAKITFAVTPEVVKFVDKNITHEVGLHIHPGMEIFNVEGVTYIAGDMFLNQFCPLNGYSTVLRDYYYESQHQMIKAGKEYLQEYFSVELKVFVAGRWSINNDSIRVLTELGFTHDCSAQAHSKQEHYDWSKLPRICMPYHPSEDDYQTEGTKSLLIVPISQCFPVGNVNPEAIPSIGLSWLKACFLEYLNQGMPLFHICLHSPCMTDEYFISEFDKFLRYISNHNVNFIFASQVREYPKAKPKTMLKPYLFGINLNLLKSKLRLP